MYNSKAVIEYWQQGAQQEALMSFNPAQVQDKWQVISVDELQRGNIDDQTTIAKLLGQGSRIIVAPTYLQKDNTYFIPYLLQVNLQPDGSLKPSPHNAIPVFPRNLFESQLIDTISMGFAESFDDYLVLQTPNWIDEPDSISWCLQLQYAQQMLYDVTGNKWYNDLEKIGYVKNDCALVFALSHVCQPIKMDYKLLQDKAKIELISAERNSGKSTYAKRKIIDAWIESAVKQTVPPRYVWLQHNSNLRYTSIFCCANTVTLRVPESEYAAAKELAHKELSQVFNLYIKGKQIARNWQELSKRLDAKYLDKGGIQSRIKQLHALLKEAQAKFRHMQVLQSIWVRQSELLTSWTKTFDIFPFMQKQRLQRLYMFFKQNFSNEDVTGLSQDQLDNNILDKINRTRNSERFIADALHQAENDLLQQELVADKLLQWGKLQNPALCDVLEVLDYLHQKLWLHVVSAATYYWQLDFSLNNDRDNFLTSEPTDIEMLIVEHAEYVSPMQGARLLALSKRAIIMGNYNPICNPLFPVVTDFELAKHCNLAKSDADYEDMQFDGFAASLGNLWNLAAQGKEAEQIFTQYPGHAKTYNFINIATNNSDYRGSKINIGEADAILAWLHENKPAALEVTIFTTYAGQIHYLRQLLQTTNYLSVPIYLVQQPYFVANKTVLFSTVYTANDPGPYCFDRGVEILDNLLANTQQQLYVFGDQRIFKPELHSAAGNFAKLFNVSKSINIEEQEVSCV